MVGKADDLLFVRLEAHLRAAEDEDDVGADAFDGGEDFGGFNDVPDINTQADDFRSLREQDFRYVERALIDVEFR